MLIGALYMLLIIYNRGPGIFVVLRGSLAVVCLVRKIIMYEYLNRFMIGGRTNGSCGSNFTKNGSSDKLFQLHIILDFSPVK